jgi:hypothetical protein
LAPARRAGLPPVGTICSSPGPVSTWGGGLELGSRIGLVAPLTARRAPPRSIPALTRLGDLVGRGGWKEATRRSGARGNSWGP